MHQPGSRFRLQIPAPDSGPRFRPQIPAPASHDGALGGGEVYGLDAGGQGLLQVLQDVGHRGLRRGVVQQLLEGVHLDQDHHVLQEVAFDVGRKLDRS